MRNVSMNRICNSPSRLSRRNPSPGYLSFTDREGQWGTGRDKTALLSGSSSLRGTGRDRERHPVALRLRSMFSASELPVFGTIRDSGGCEKRASEPGDEAFEVGASPFSMLRPSCRRCLRLERRCSRFGHLLVLLDGTGAHADGAHDITVAAQGYAARKDHEVAPVRVAKAEEGPSRLCLVHQVLCLALEGYRGIGFIDRDGNASYESAVHPDVCLEVPTRVDYCDVHGAVDLLRLLFCGGDNPPRLL